MAQRKKPVEESFSVPEGFEKYLSRQRNQISRLKYPAIEVRDTFLILNPAAVREIDGRNHVVILWNSAAREVGLWFFRNPVDGSARVNGRSKNDLRYISFKGFRHRYLNDGEISGPITRRLLQDKDSTEFFRFSISEE